MKFLNPIASISDEKLADWSAVFPIEIDRVSPFVFFIATQIIVRKRTEIISVRPEMIVDDVQNDAESKRMCAIDEGAQSLRCSVKTSRREKIDAIVTPAKTRSEERRVGKEAQA